MTNKQEDITKNMNNSIELSDEDMNKVSAGGDTDSLKVWYGK